MRAKCKSCEGTFVWMPKRGDKLAGIRSPCCGAACGGCGMGRIMTWTDHQMMEAVRKCGNVAGAALLLEVHASTIRKRLARCQVADPVPRIRPLTVTKRVWTVEELEEVVLRLGSIYRATQETGVSYPTIRKRISMAVIEKIDRDRRP